MIRATLFSPILTRFGVGLVVLLTLIPYTKVYVADMQVVRGQNYAGTPSYGRSEQFTKAITLFPQHLFVSHKIILEAQQQKRHTDVIKASQYMKGFSPYYFTLDYYMANAFLNLEQIDSAQYYLNQEMARHKQLTQGILLQAEILSLKGIFRQRLHILLLQG